MKVIIANLSLHIQWGGVYYFTLADYPNIADWELKKLTLFAAYERLHGREPQIECESEDIARAVDNALLHPETVSSAALPAKLTNCTACLYKGCHTELLSHTASIENASSILSGGKILSAVKALGMTGDAIAKSTRNAASDPPDYFDYVMLSWGNCQAGDSLVMERLRGRAPDETDLGAGFIPGVRFYFRYADILSHPGCVHDGYHAAKVRDEICLSDYLIACVAPKCFENEIRSAASADIGSRIFFLEHKGKDIWQWSKTVYDFVAPAVGVR